MDTEKNTPTPEAAIPEPSLQTASPASKQKSVKKIAVLTAATAVLVIVLILLLLGFGCKVPADTSLGGVDISGMNLVQAHTALEDALEDTLYTQNLTVSLPQDTITLSPDASGVRVSSWKAVWSARKGGSLSLDPFLKVRENAVSLWKPMLPSTIPNSPSPPTSWKVYALPWMPRAMTRKHLARPWS